MAKQESTAINDLIAQVARRPMPPDDASAQSDAAFRTQRGLSNVLRTPAVPTAHVTTPVGTMTMQGVGALPAATRTTKTPASMPVAAPFDAPPVRLPPAAAPVSFVPTMSQEWFARGDQEQAWVGTLQLQKRARGRSASKLIPGLILLAAFGVFVGYVVFDNSGTRAPAVTAAAPMDPAPAPAKAAVPDAPAPAPAPVAVAAPSKLVDVTIVSAPAGATVTLVDRGATSLVGKTPVVLALEPSHKVELVFSHPNQPTQIEALDPSTTRRVDVTLGQAAAAAVATEAPQAAPAPAAPVRRRATPARAAVEDGEGTLMITSKPPCEIVIDGKPTGLTTPQRAIALSAGPHEITLVNEDEDIRKQISVRIRADQATKVIENLMESE